jgi:hypothetical protein
MGPRLIRHNYLGKKMGRARNSERHPKSWVDRHPHWLTFIQQLGLVVVAVILGNGVRRTLDEVKFTFLTNEWTIDSGFLERDTTVAPATRVKMHLSIRNPTMVTNAAARVRVEPTKYSEVWPIEDRGRLDAEMPMLPPEGRYDLGYFQATTHKPIQDTVWVTIFDYRDSEKRVLLHHPVVYAVR